MAVGTFVDLRDLFFDRDDHPLISLRALYDHFWRLGALQFHPGIMLLRQTANAWQYSVDALLGLELDMTFFEECLIAARFGRSIDRLWLPSSAEDPVQAYMIRAAPAFPRPHLARIEWVHDETRSSSDDDGIQDLSPSPSPDDHADADADADQAPIAHTTIPASACSPDRTDGCCETPVPSGVTKIDSNFDEAKSSERCEIVMTADDFAWQDELPLHLQHAIVSGQRERGRRGSCFQRAATKTFVMLFAVLSALVQWATSISKRVAPTAHDLGGKAINYSDYSLLCVLHRTLVAWCACEWLLVAISAAVTGAAFGVAFTALCLASPSAASSALLQCYGLSLQLSAMDPHSGGFLLHEMRARPLITDTMDPNVANALSVCSALATTTCAFDSAWRWQTNLF